MLTGAHRVYHWDKRTNSISSDRLDDAALPFLEKALLVYRGRVGDSRGRVRNAARRALEGLRPDRVEPAVKVLDDLATYEWPKSGRQAERRVEIFGVAAKVFPLLEAEGAAAIVAQHISPAPAPGEETVAALYADYPEFHVLAAFPEELSAEELLGRYDLGQAQALLYLATEVVVEAQRDFKRVLRYARLARLLWRMEPLGKGYRFQLDGPNSILRRTRSYGVDFARFLAALVRLKGWRLRAQIQLRRGWRPFTFELAARDDLGAHLSTLPEFDSLVEKNLAKKFGRKRLEGWKMTREGAVIEAGDSLMVPDFVFTHQDGTTVILEIAGYWTPEYIESKFKKLAATAGHHLIVAVPKRLALKAGALPARVLPFGKKIRVKDLLLHLEAFRSPRPLGPG